MQDTMNPNPPSVQPKTDQQIAAERAHYARGFSGRIMEALKLPGTAPNFSVFMLASGMAIRASDADLMLRLVAKLVFELFVYIPNSARLPPHLSAPSILSHLERLGYAQGLANYLQKHGFSHVDARDAALLVRQAAGFLKMEMEAKERRDREWERDASESERMRRDVGVTMGMLSMEQEDDSGP